MKKLIALLLSMIVGSALFADYRGDLQIRPIGFGANTMKDNGASLDAVSYNFALQTYHTWGATKSPLKFGFSAGYDFGLVHGDIDGLAENGGYSFDFAMGPAASFKINKVVKFDTAIMFDFIGYYDNDIDCGGFGIAWDFVAVFLPEAVFSPLAGINYISTSVDGHADGNDGKHYDIERDYSRFKFFIGGAFNFGRRN